MLVKVKMPNGKVVEMEEQSAIASGLEIVRESVKSGYFNRPQPIDFLKKFRDENGTLDDFTACNVVEKKKFTSKKGRTMLVLADAKEPKNIHLVIAESLSQLQEDNPSRKILIGEDGEIAPVGSPCVLNESELIGRENGTMVLG